MGQDYLVSRLVEIGPVFLDKKMKMLKVYNSDSNFNDRQCKNFDPKTHFSLCLRCVIIIINHRDCVTWENFNAICLFRFSKKSSVGMASISEQKNVVYTKISCVYGDILTLHFHRKKNVNCKQFVCNVTDICVAAPSFWFFIFSSTCIN